MSPKSSETDPKGRHDNGKKNEIEKSTSGHPMLMILA